LATGAAIVHTDRTRDQRVPRSAPRGSLDQAQGGSLTASGVVESGSRTHADSASSAAFIWVRRIGVAVLGLQFVGLVLLSLAIYQRFALTQDYASYNQAWYLIAHGDLNPFSTALDFPFWRNNGEFLMWPLALVGVPFGNGIVLLWIQDAAIVGAEAVALFWVCDVVRRPTWNRRFPPWLAVGTALVLLVANPWVYWAVAFDFHMEPLAALFIVLAARDVERRRFNRAAVWVVLTLLCGDLAAALVAGLGLGAMVAGRPWRRAGLVLIVVGVAWVGMLSVLGMKGGDLSAAYGYLAVQGTAVPSHVSLPSIVTGVLLHPVRVVHVLWVKRHNIVSNLAPSGLLGIFSPWGFGVTAVLVLANNLSAGLIFSTSSFQYLPMYALMVVGTVMVLGRFARWGGRGAAVAVTLAVLLAADTLGWAAVWVPRTAGHWILTSPGAAAVLARIDHQIPAGAEVIVSQGVAGRFSSRRWIYTVRGPRSVPVRASTVWVIVAPLQGAEPASVQEEDALVAEIAGTLGAQLVVNDAGIWAFRWVPQPGVRTLTVPGAVPTIAGWTVAGAAGRALTVGPATNWTAVATGRRGYVVAGDYWHEPPGRYTATVSLSTGVPVDVEVWDDAGHVLLAHRRVTPTNGSEAVTLPVDATRSYPQHLDTGAGPFRITPEPPPPGDPLEIRVWTPGGRPVAVSSLELVPSGGSRQ